MRLLKDALILTILALLAGLAHSMIRPVDITVIDTSTRGEEVAPGVVRRGKFLFVSPTRAHELHQAGLTQFFDASSDEEYEEGHIEGAVHLPIEDVSEGSFPQALEGLPPDMPMIVYCSSGCDIAQIVVERLQEMGYSNVMVFDGPFDVWKKAGYPSVSR